MKNNATIITETAWNLYRAFRTYDGPKRAMEDARIFIPDPARVYRFTTDDEWVDPSDTLERTGDALIDGPADISHARAIALWFNLDRPTLDDDFNRWGINALTECIAHEIETGTEATWGQCRESYEQKVIRYSDERFTPYIFGMHDFSLHGYLPALYPYITLNLSVYESRTDFLDHASRILPGLYDRLHRMKNTARDNYDRASEKALEEWRRQAEMTPRKISRVVREGGEDALFGHLRGEEWRRWEAEKCAYRERLETWRAEDRVYWENGGEIAFPLHLWNHNLSPPRAPGAPKADPPSGLTEEEWRFYWHFCLLDPDGTCRVCLPQVAIGAGPIAAPSRLLRGRYLSTDRKRTLKGLHRHAGWWSAVRNGEKSNRRAAKDAGVEHSTVLKAIRRLEEDFMLGDGGGAP